MRVSAEDVTKVASLSMLQVEGEKVEKMQQDLDEILAHAERLNELDTEGVEPTTNITKQQNVLREDVEEEPWDKDALMSNAAKQDGGYFTVPQVVD